MGSGLQSALGEVTLVVFTTLAPSGALALALSVAVLMTGVLGADERARVNKCLCIPLTVAMVGLVASATHLGNPDNALYVFLAIGQSPLSNEVFCAVAFLGISGVYWLYSFSVRPVLWLQRALQVLVVVTAVAFVTAVALAYSARTIPTWNLPSVPVALWLNALVGGPLLALFTLQAARIERAFGRWGMVLCVASAVVLVANVVVYVLQGWMLSGVGNTVASAMDLVPLYWPMVVAFALLGAASVGLMAVGCRKATSLAEPLATLLAMPIASLVLVFAGIFIMRLVFYMTHLTFGLGTLLG